MIWLNLHPSEGGPAGNLSFDSTQMVDNTRYSWLRCQAPAFVSLRLLGEAMKLLVSCGLVRRIEEEMTFPGEIKVTVREVRAEATAR